MDMVTHVLMMQPVQQQNVVPTPQPLIMHADMTLPPFVVHQAQTPIHTM